MIRNAATEALNPNAEPSPEPILKVIHVGRAGEAPGGMTQVINSYLDHAFDRVAVSVLVSRRGPGDPVSVLLAVMAAIRLTAMALSDRGRQRRVMVFHLSQRGSFLREGLLLLLASTLCVPTVAHLHGSNFVDFSRRSPRLSGRVLRAATRVFVLSHLSHDAVTNLGVASDRVSLVPNTVPRGRNDVPKKREVMFAGAVSHRKGVDVLLAAWQQVGAPDWTLVVAGPDLDGFGPQLKSAIECSQVAYVGPLAHDDVLRRLEASVVAVLPSRDEAMPMFILEAMARKNYVVATAVGGIPMMLPDADTRLIEPGDVEALSAQLKVAVSDFEATRLRGETDYAHFIAQFSAESRMPKVELLWLEAAGRRSQTRPRPDGSPPNSSP